MQDTQKNVIGTVLQFMGQHQSIWKKYFQDFITYKLHFGRHVENGDPKFQSDIPLQILQYFFKQLNRSGNEMKNKMVQLHCHSAVYHLNLAQLAILFRPLCEVHEVNFRNNVCQL